LFEAQVAAMPERIALLFEDLELSYAELDEKANRLAHYLVKAGVQPEMLIGVCMERSPEMIISFLAVWKAGGAYVPLDPAYPVDRLAYMIADAQTSIILTDEASQAIAKEAAGEHAASIFTMALLEEELAQMPAGKLPAASGPENLAYVIYTSGSTGQPKGVMIEHRSACNLVFAQRAKAPVSPSAIALQFASTSFDASVLEILMALCNGAALVVAGKKDLMPGPELTATLNRYRVSHCVLSPTSMGQLDPAQLPHLKWVISGGEALPLSLVQKWSALINVVNEYGPTEATVAATAALTTVGQEQVTIGRPLANYWIYILGRHQELLPPGLPGEIHIAGAGLARGYLNRPELTEEKFISNLFGEGGKMYKTGDLARWLPNGEIEFLGRIDHQVKIRGFRIECGEIESALMGMAGIREVAVVDKVDTHGQKYLCAYYVSEKEKEVGELRAFLAETLPDFMIPSLFESLERLPLTPNGKVDRKALKDRAITFTLRGKTTAPRNNTELQLCRIWQAILDVPEIGIGDNFFEWGGDSIKAIPLIDKIQEVFQIRIPVHAIFQNPTVELLAKHLASVKAEHGTRDSHLIPLQPSGTRPPLFFAPGVEGKCYYLYELAQAIGKEQPLYGFQSCGLQPGEEALESIEAIAGFNIRLMKVVQPEGPYYLAGHSLGGWVAFEMAHQLTAEGEEVAFLGLMDAYSPSLLTSLGLLSPASDDPELNDLMLAVERLAAYYHVDVEMDSLLRTLRTIQASDRLDFVLRWAMELKLLPPSFSAQELWQWAHLMGAYSRMSYHPPLLSQEIHLFRATDQELPPHKIPEYLGWEEHTERKVRKIMAPGTHTSMMKQPQVSQLADLLKQYIDAAAAPGAPEKSHRKLVNQQPLDFHQSDRETAVAH
jgi:amino acid adenylation domain-containing protein